MVLSALRLTCPVRLTRKGPKTLSNPRDSDTARDFVHGRSAITAPGNA
jgi:hypothetical protein